MTVYVENILALAKPLAVTNNIGEYSEKLLYDEVLSNNVAFSASGTVITAGWGLNCYADSVAVLGSNWTVGKLAVTSQGEEVFNKTIASRGRNTIIKLPEAFMVSGIRLELNTRSEEEKLEVGILFAGRGTELPLFNTGFKYRLNVNSKAERTRYGIVYGSKKSSLRSFEITFSGIDNSRRQVLEDYIDAVQYVRPHLVEPYESDEFPPVYAALTDAGGFDKRDNPRWAWDTALNYTEAK